MKTLGKIIVGALLTGWTGLISFGIYEGVNNRIRYNKVKYVLDINRDEKLSIEEIKVFFDETETSPYTQKLLEGVPTPDYKAFLDKRKK
jgi:hypothetical protein